MERKTTKPIGMKIRQARLPVGIDQFEKLREGGYYYVDKTELIEQVIEEGCEVTLFTRPRRFGKTLNMSMLQYFFEIGMDPTLFDGLYIAQNKDLCDTYMGRYPVVSISLKGVDADSYEKARAQLIRIINKEARRHRALLEDEKMDAIDRELFVQFLDRQMEDDTITSSLQELTELLEIHFFQKVVVLIDEYDVPLAKAYENGYYDDMVLLLRNMFGNVLKSNDSLAFAVLTGCLRIAKESIFTGLNNFKVYSITDQEFDETFGFTDAEVKAMLQYYGLQDYFDAVREWYDGYRFGKVDVYCPWDVVNYCSDHRKNPDVEMKDSGTPWCPLIPIHWKYANPKALFTQRLDRAYPGDKQLTASQEYGVIYQDEYMELTGTKIVTVMKDFSILKHVEPNDFVISMRSFQGGLEYSERRGSISSAYVMLIPNNEYVYPPFYRWFFKSSKYINAIQSTSNLVRDGQAMRYANFAQVPLFIIPLDEQKQISEYLDEKVRKIDEILKSKKSQLEILAEYKKSLIYEYVTGKKEVPAI